MKRKAALLAAILAAWLIIVVRGRGDGPIPLSVAVKAATNGSFYHWRAEIAGERWAEGWCAQRRSRTIDSDGIEVRTSPSGIYRKAKGRATLDPRTDVIGMEEGNDFLTETAARLTGLDAKLTPLSGDRWQGGAAVYTLEPSHRPHPPHRRTRRAYRRRLPSRALVRPVRSAALAQGGDTLCIMRSPGNEAL